MDIVFALLSLNIYCGGTLKDSDLLIYIIVVIFNYFRYIQCWKVFQLITCRERNLTDVCGMNYIAFENGAAVLYIFSTVVLRILHRKKYRALNSLCGTDCEVNCIGLNSTAKNCILL